MPLVRISVGEAVEREKRRLLADAVYDAMRATIGIPEGDKFMVLTAHAEDELIADPHFQGVQRTNEFVVIQIALRRGRHDGKEAGAVSRDFEAV